MEVMEMSNKNGWRFIEISDEVFIDADVTMKYYNINTGANGYRKVHSLFPNKEIITITNEDYLEAHTVLGALENKMIQREKDRARLLLDEESKEMAEIRLADAIPEREEYEAQLINDEEKLIIP
jgi:hypothetical protein